MCLSASNRSTTSAGVPFRPRVLLFLQRLDRAWHTISTSRSSSRTASLCRIQGSHRSETSSAMRPSAKVVCALWVSIMILPPPLGAIFAQKLLIDFADLFQSLAHAVEVLQLLTDLRDLGGMDCPSRIFGGARSLFFVQANSSIAGPQAIGQPAGFVRRHGWPHTPLSRQPKTHI